MIETFLDKQFGWKEIRQKANNFIIYPFDNDPFVPISMGKEIANNLNGDFILVKNTGHFNAAAGYTDFPQLLEKIKQKVGVNINNNARL